MAKSIKLKNNNFLDTSGITHNRDILKYFLFLRQLPTQNGSYDAMGDRGTYTFTISYPKVYLYVNTHIYMRSIILITCLNNSTMSVDTLFTSSGSAVPTITKSGTTLTIVNPGNARANLYDITNQICG